MALKAGREGISDVGAGLKLDKKTGKLFLEGESDLTLDNLKDVDIDEPAAGDVLAYGSGKWENVSPDDEPTKNSTKPITSGGVYNALDDIWEANAKTGVKNLMSATVVKLKPANTDVGNTTFSTDNQAKSFCAKLEHNTKYKISRAELLDPDADFVVVLSASEPAANGNCSVIFSDASDTSWSFNSASYNYVLLFCGDISESAADLEPMLQFDADTSAGYEPYTLTNQELTEKVTALGSKFDLLWTNPSPSTGIGSFTFNSITQDLDYDFLLIECETASNNITTNMIILLSSNEGQIMSQVSLDFESANQNFMLTRWFWFDNNKLQTYKPSRMSLPGGALTNDDKDLNPLKICGVKLK